MDKHTRNKLWLDRLRLSRALRYSRKHPYYDPEIFKITAWVIATSGLFYLALWFGMDSLYDILDRAGVFSAIFKFMGW